MVDISLAAPDSFLLYSQKNSTSRMIFDYQNSPNVILPIQGIRNIKALAFDPVEEAIYWIDGRKGIKKAWANGTGVSASSIFLTPSKL